MAFEVHAGGNSYSGAGHGGTVARMAGDDDRAVHLISVLQNYLGRGLLAPAQAESLINRIQELSARGWDPGPDCYRWHR